MDILKNEQLSFIPERTDNRTPMTITWNLWHEGELWL